MLAGALGIGLSALVIACDPDDSPSGSGDPDDPGADPTTTTPTPGPDADVALLEAAVTTEQALVASYEATLKAQAALAELIKPMAANHRTHVTYLSALVTIAAAEPLPVPLPDPATDPPSDDPTPDETPPAKPPKIPPSVGEALAALTRAEQQAATSHLGDVKTAAGGEVARLFASLSACAQSHVFHVELNGGAYVS